MLTNRHFTKKIQCYTYLLLSKDCRHIGFMKTFVPFIFFRKPLSYGDYWQARIRLNISTSVSRHSLLKLGVLVMQFIFINFFLDYFNFFAAFVLNYWWYNITIIAETVKNLFRLLLGN